jgi:hypothetical protein
MIPSIETIVEDLYARTITRQQAIGWLHQHAEHAGRDLRDEFAEFALQGWLANPSSWEPTQADKSVESFDNMTEVSALAAYKFADAMLIERNKSR